MPEIQKQSRHRDLDTLQGYIQLADKHSKEVYMRTMPSFAPEQTVIPKTETNMKETLLRKLLNGEISDSAFNNAMKLMEAETPSLANTGYHY